MRLEIPGIEAFARDVRQCRADVRVEWEALDAQIFPRTPFTSPLWIGLWWNHLRRQRPLLRDEFFCHTVRDADGRLVEGKFIGKKFSSLPVMSSRSDSIGAHRPRAASCFTAWHSTLRRSIRRLSDIGGGEFG